MVPIKFTLDDFMQDTQENHRFYSALQEENLSGSELIDNLILLRFIDTYAILGVLRDKYELTFSWLNADPTPADLKELAEKYHVLIERGKNLIVYVPLGIELDDATLQIDIPDYVVKFRFIADCNYRLLQTGLSAAVLSPDIVDFRPRLVFRRLVLDCIERCGTDLHFESIYVDKAPMHIIRYRIKRELVPSDFHLDFQMMRRIITTAVGSLSPASGMEVDATTGLVTSISDIFHDGTCDLRVTIIRVDAGFYCDFAIQTTTTTLKTIPELGFTERDAAKIADIATRRTGLTLVTGEMRSGKNTTIFSMLNELVKLPIRIIEYSNPIENRMPFPQINYGGNTETLKSLMRMAKKQDLDIVVLNEIPSADVAFAVRDLVNSAIGVITTLHIDRLWHLPYKLREFYDNDYKTIISQLNAVINQKMFTRWISTEPMQKRILNPEQGAFERFCYIYGVRQYFVPQDMETITTELQPMVEILVLTDEIKTAMLNFPDLYQAEQMLTLRMKEKKELIEYKLAEFINSGRCSLDEMRRIYKGGV